MTLLKAKLIEYNNNDFILNNRNELTVKLASENLEESDDFDDSNELDTLSEDHK